MQGHVSVWGCHECCCMMRLPLAYARAGGTAYTAFAWISSQALGCHRSCLGLQQSVNSHQHQVFVAHWCQASCNAPRLIACSHLPSLWQDLTLRSNEDRWLFGSGAKPCCCLSGQTSGIAHWMDRCFLFHFGIKHWFRGCHPCIWTCTFTWASSMGHQYL